MNGKVVLTRRSLSDGDIVLVGKHQLVFAEPVLVDDAEAVLETLGDTVYLDTPEHRAHLARLRAVNSGKTVAEAASEPATDAAERVGVLRVLSGRVDRREYTLEASCLIGRSPHALVRLRGWFKPETAAAIVRSDTGYALNAVDGRARVNHRPLGNRRHELQDGDIVEVAGVVMRFDLSAPVP